MKNIPERIGKYEVLRRLGYGGMGTVFLAKDPDLDRLLAIKVVRDVIDDEELMQRFLREARAAGNLRHENIITVYDAGQHDHQPFMAMEYVDGVSLAEIIRARQPLDLVGKLWYLEQICAGLHYAHSRGIVHRDIKPANLMVDGRHIVRILDFGIARTEGSGMTRDGSMIGTLNYMSPEQMLGVQVDHRSDIFSFGAVAYELISYERAFPGTIDDGLLHRLPNEPPRPLAEVCPGLPPEVEPLVMRALAKKPQDRFADLDEARAALRQIRRQLDPNVEPLETDPALTAERREVLARVARQAAYHREAARSALKYNDLDAAREACDDALALDPDDREAQQLKTEIEQAREQRGLETQKRREIDRIVRRHIANADVKLSKGDTAGAKELLLRAFEHDPQNETARALWARTGEPLPPLPAAPTVVRPLPRPRTGSDAVSAEGGHTPAPGSHPGGTVPAASASSSGSTPFGAPSPASSAPSSAASGTAAALAAEAATAEPAKTSSTVRYVAAAAALAAVAVVALVLLSTSGEPPAADLAARVDVAATGPADSGQGASDPAPSASDDVNAGAESSSASTATPPAPSATEPVAAAPAPAPTPAAPEPERQQPPAVPAGRGSAPAAPGPSPVADAAPARPAVVPIDFGPFDRALGAGDLAGALTYLEGLPNQSDERIRAAARRAAERAMDDMAAAETRASLLKAGDLAAPQFATASAEKTRAERAFERDDFAQAARQAVASATSFRSAADEARRVDEARKKAAEAAAAKAAEAAAAKPVAASFDEAGVWNAMLRFQAAYAKRDISAIRQVASNLSQVAANTLRQSLDQCRDASVSFVSPTIAPASNDPTAAIVTVRSNYVCQPKIRAPAQENSRDEVFGLRKVGDTWLIERMGSWDAQR